MENRTSRPNIKSLPNGHIFVFGSNMKGIHGAGAALTARKKFGATIGRMHGMDNNSYGIPTKDENLITLPIYRIKKYVENFLFDASLYPDNTFHVTEIGCGLAGYTPDKIAPLFEGARIMKNILLPKSFWEILNG